MAEQVCNCERCRARCRVAGPKNPDARMLRKSAVPTGFCVNCATHDFLRNTYPVNILLAESGPICLLLPHIRTQFAAIMQSAKADANIDEINWNLINENWDLPWREPVRPTAANPSTQKDLDEIAAGKRRAFGNWPPKPDPLKGVDTITSLGQLNELEPGLGDNLKAALDREFKGTALEFRIESGQITGKIVRDVPPAEPPSPNQTELF